MSRCCHRRRHARCRRRAICDPCCTYYEDYAHPQHVDVIQPIRVVRRHHCVPVYHHKTCYSCKDVYCNNSNSCCCNNNCGCGCSCGCSCW